MKLQTLEDMWRFAQYAVKAGIRSSGKRPMTAEMAFCVIQYGDELGIGPMASLKGITYKGDTPTVDGDLALGLVRASDNCEYVVETFDPATETAMCEAKRKDQSQVIVRTFSMDDARKANLVGKYGPWKDYPHRMLRYRALGFCLRDAFPEVMQGIHITQEVEEDTLPVPECDTPSRQERRNPEPPKTVMEEIQDEIDAAVAEADDEPQEHVEAHQSPITSAPAVASQPVLSSAGAHPLPANDAMLKILRQSVWKQFCETFELDPKNVADTGDAFIQYCMAILELPREQVNSGSKLTVPMLQKLQSALNGDYGSEDSGTNTTSP